MKNKESPISWRNICKTQAPFWKKEVTPEGARWVDARVSDDAALARDPAGSYAHNASVEAAWAVIYREPQDHWDLYELAEKLVDLEYHFQRWRFGHLKTVERIIGFKRGTGGTPGVPYLEGVLKQAFFPELLSVRTAI